MMENAVPPPAPTEQPPPEEGASPAADLTRERGGRWALPLGALAAGLILGGAVGASVVLASSDPTQTDEYEALAQDLARVEQDLQASQDRVTRMSARTGELAAEANEARELAAQRQAELDEREADLVAREQAVTATENQMAATSISHGIWTVGVDVEPGTYRTKEALTGYCYWAIYTSGTNGDDIIENDGPEGGFPTVTLSAGQDFENNGCGTFVKQ